MRLRGGSPRISSEDGQGGGYETIRENDVFLRNYGYAGLATGCATITKGEARVLETRVLGLDLSIPVPGMEGVTNLANIRMGWIEVKYVHEKGTAVRSYSDHKDISLLTGKGSVERDLTVGGSGK